ADLGVAEKTVKVHRARVMHKLEARAVADLVRLVRSPPTSASRKRPSRSTAPGSCTSSRRAPSPTSCAS
ncbi:hypothetical protein CNY89_30535, partial [Amaricoccus sp. HAR-UPW-R2A-40]